MARSPLFWFIVVSATAYVALQVWMLSRMRGHRDFRRAYVEWILLRLLAWLMIIGGLLAGLRRWPWLGGVSVIGGVILILFNHRRARRRFRELADRDPTKTEGGNRQ